MKVVLQRVTSASVEVEGESVGQIGAGLLALVGVVAGDTDLDLAWTARKILGLRIFSDLDGKMNRSVIDTGGEVLLVSQFTICADVRKGTRPSFGRAMPPAEAKEVFDQLAREVGKTVNVETGRFQAAMKVALVNDGPVTIWLDSKEKS